MLAGKLPGVRIQQRTGEPGSYDAKMDIRGLGTPLVVIDGVVREVSDFQRLEANDIESVSVLKDAICRYLRYACIEWRVIGDDS